MKIMQTGPMTTLTQRIARLTLGLGLAATLAFGAVVSASADDVTGTSTVTTGGAISMSLVDTAASFGVTLDGTNKSATDTVGIEVNDNSGSGAGWRLQVASSTFKNSGDTHSLATTGTLSVFDVDVADNGSGTYTQPTNSVSYPLALTQSATPTAVSLYNAAANTGMGQFTITPTLKVNIPANAYADSYTSTVTITLSSGPN